MNYDHRNAGSAPVTAVAHAKVNLHLGVGDCRSDGFHDLVSVFQSVDLATRVTLTPLDWALESAESAVHKLTVAGPDAADIPTDQSNLAWRAIDLAMERGFVRSDECVPVDIHIDKAIPVAGGMAGGSADAAAALVAANELWQLGLTREDLFEVAAELGSDVPFCLHGGTAIGTGRGEELTQVLTRGQLHWALAFFDEGLGTPQVFRRLDELRTDLTRPDNYARLAQPMELLRALASADIQSVAKHLHNDLQIPATEMRADVARILQVGTDAGALGALVSGSGPTCAFLCESAEVALQVADELAANPECGRVLTTSSPATGAHLVK
ncbi:4-(cytidine 5'-diphospho)-2-C-methyl-D-erythritol kinase [Corynebacterium ulceribovis]|uniref:4-(cytidine 5'-diphospho)-2-C-methyl-D-erythritol kinase n=1 Tax=Corynebacterium ulceribovis TaxID=487732 RepID=UPI00035DEE4C|nr:4-(cytidine 5'-diphospho)-2-C-methyl-D-erythritol kinase [Corynebacterium ulceribovis]